MRKRTRRSGSRLSRRGNGNCSPRRTATRRSTLVLNRHYRDNNEDDEPLVITFVFVHRPTATPPPAALVVPPPVKIEIAPIAVRDSSPAAVSRVGKTGEHDKIDNEAKKSDNDDEDDAPIIPWRAQLRKTNSKLNIID